MKKLLAKIKYALGKAASRKGMGMELALLVLFVVMACSILLVSSAMVGKDNLSARKEQMLQRLEMDRLAQKALTEGDAFSDDSANYDRKWSDDKNTLYITDRNSNIVLTVILDDGKITHWHYS